MSQERTSTLDQLILPFDESKHRIEEADQLTDEGINSFTDGKFDTVVLKAGMNLHRFVSDKHPSPFSDCWIDQRTFEDLIIYFQQAEKMTFTAKKNHVYNNIGVLTRWNTLDNRVKVMLKRDVIAYVGPIAPQKVVMEVDSIQKAIVRTRDRKNFSYDDLCEKNKVNEYRIGGQKQYRIPRLKNKSFRGDENEYARVVHNAKLHHYKGNHRRS